jgi:hypothetical protein
MIVWTRLWTPLIQLPALWASMCYVASPAGRPGYLPARSFRQAAFRRRVKSAPEGAPVGVPIAGKPSDVYSFVTYLGDPEVVTSWDGVSLKSKK